MSCKRKPWIVVTNTRAERVHAISLTAAMGKVDLNGEELMGIYAEDLLIPMPPDRPPVGLAFVIKFQPTEAEQAGT